MTDVATAPVTTQHPIYLGFRPADDPGSAKKATRRKHWKKAAEWLSDRDMLYRIDHPDESKTVFGRVHMPTAMKFSDAVWPPRKVLGIVPTTGRTTMVYYRVDPTT